MIISNCDIAPLKNSLSKTIFYCRKIVFFSKIQNSEFRIFHLREFRGKIKTLRTRYFLCRKFVKFADVRRKMHLFVSPTFLPTPPLITRRQRFHCSATNLITDTESISRVFELSLPICREYIRWLSEDLKQGSLCFYETTTASEADLKQLRQKLPIIKFVRRQRRHVAPESETRLDRLTAITSLKHWS